MLHRCDVVDETRDVVLVAFSHHTVGAAAGADADVLRERWWRKWKLRDKVTVAAHPCAA